MMKSLKKASNLSLVMAYKPLTIAVSGAAGRIGRIYAPKLLEQGHNVRVYDTHSLEVGRLYGGTAAQICTNNGQLVQDADVVLLCVPVQRIQDVLKEISPVRPDRAGDLRSYLKPDVIIGSTASAKVRIAGGYRTHVTSRYPKARVVEIHPMHGEQTRNSDFPRNQNMLTVPVHDFPVDGYTAEALMQGLFVPMEMRVRHIDSAEQHDEMLAVPQGDNHSIATYRATAWYRLGVDPDNNPVNTSPLDDAKSLHARRLVALNPDVYVVTMKWNEFVRDHLTEYEEILSEVDDMRIDGRRDDLCRMFENARDNIGWDAIKDARERLAAAYGTEALDSSVNSHISDLVWGEHYRRRGIKPTDFLDIESFHYTLGRIILCAVYGGDIRKLVDNYMRNPETQKHDRRFSQAVPLVNAAIEGTDEGLLRHFGLLRRFYNGEAGVEMKRNLSRVSDDSAILTRKLQEVA